MIFSLSPLSIHLSNIHRWICSLQETEGGRRLTGTLSTSEGRDQLPGLRRGGASHSAAMIPSENETRWRREGEEGDEEAKKKPWGEETVEWEDRKWVQE